MQNILEDPKGENFRVISVHNSARLVLSPFGGILFYSPPETLKHLFAKKLPVPSVIVLPPDIPAGQEIGSSGFVYKGINYACFEFILYFNYFVAGGKKTRIITVSENQASRVKQILQEVISGPFHLFSNNEYGWLEQECRYVTYLDSIGRSPNQVDLAEVTSLEKGGKEVFSGITLDYADSKFAISENDQRVLILDSAIADPPMPWVLAPPRPLLRQEITLQFVGSGDGFDPNEITTCFLAYISQKTTTKTILVDAAAYLQIRLGNLGVSFGQIRDVVVTHVHEDHIAGLPELLLMGQNRLRIITSDLVYLSLIRVLSGVLGVSEKDVAGLFDFAPTNPGTPLRLDELTFEVMYAVHSIPTIALRVSDLYYSGDMIYNEEWFLKLESEGVISSSRRANLIDFANGALILIQDVGGGSIHTTLTSEVFKALATKAQHLILAHTGKRNLPEGDGYPSVDVQFATSGLVKSIGKVIENQEDLPMLETFSACPLFARLKMERRLDLAQHAKIISYNAGDVVMREGDLFNGNTYIIHSGVFEVWVNERLVLVVSRGSSIGERGALYGDPRTGTIVARTNGELLALNMDLFSLVSQELNLQEAFARAEWLWRNPSFRHFPWATLLDLALDFEPRLLEPGDTIFRFGDPGGTSYLLISGVFSLKNKHNESLVTFTESGEFFGGRTALEGKTHRTTVVALEKTEVWALPISGLQRLQMIYPNVLLHLKAVDVG